MHKLVPRRKVYCCSFHESFKQKRRKIITLSDKIFASGWKTNTSIQAFLKLFSCIVVQLIFHLCRNNPLIKTRMLVQVGCCFCFVLKSAFLSFPSLATLKRYRFCLQIYFVLLSSIELFHYCLTATICKCVYVCMSCCVCVKVCFLNVNGRHLVLLFLRFPTDYNN